MIKLPQTKIEWGDEIGSWTGVLGAILISANIGTEGIAFFIFIFSNLCFIYVAAFKKLYGLRRMNIIYFFINLLGIWRWIIQPWLGG